MKGLLTKEFLGTKSFFKVYIFIIAICIAVSYTHLTLPTNSRV